MTNAANEDTLLFTGRSSSYMRNAQARWNATPTIEDANPNQNKRSCPRIFAAVAAAPPATTSLPRIITLPDVDVRPSKNLNPPAILALKAGEVSVISIVAAALILISPL